MQRPLAAALVAVTTFALLATALAACESGSEPPLGCAVHADCPEGQICRDGSCEIGCLSNGDCEAGFCIDNQCVLRPPELCDCQPESACTETASECRSDLPGRPCIHDAACDDGNACSIDTCVEGFCRYKAAGAAVCCDDAADCDDGDSCTVDRCDAFRCQNVRRPACCTADSDCDDDDPCTRDFCADGVCDSDLPDPTCCRADDGCDDGDPCTTDRCLAGLCVHRVEETDEACACFGTGDCDDGNPCTLDRCLGNRCSYVPSGASGEGTGRETVCCEHVDACGAADEGDTLACEWNVCVEIPREPCEGEADCDDEDACTVDACSGGFCTHAPVAATNCCNTVEDCVPGSDCSVPSCTFNRCGYAPRIAEGCCAEPIECDDGLACTVEDCVSFECVYRPDGEGCCLGAADCDDGNDCTIDECGEDARCVRTVAEGCCVDNRDCDDGQPCTDDRCESNHCVNPPLPADACCSAPEDCEDDDPCTDTSCVQARCRVTYREGCCTTAAGCHDGDPCTADSCVDGACVFTPREDCCRADADCPSPDPCLLGRCRSGVCETEPQEGCCLSDAECDDGDDVCTTDRCIEDVCVYASTGLAGCCLRDSDCASADPCQAGTCGADGDCSFTAVPDCCASDGACDDGDYCTDDRCDGEHRCEHVFNGAEGCCSPLDWRAGFDGEDHGWTVDNSAPTVGWRIDPHRVFSGAASLYYGDPPWYHYDGDVPTANHGTVTSPEIALAPGQAYRLLVYLLVDVRSALDVDRLELRVIELGADEGGAERETTVWTRAALSAVGGTTGGVFVPVVVRLDAFAGRTIRLRIAFDTVDTPQSEVDGLEGVYVDSLSVEAVCPDRSR